MISSLKYKGPPRALSQDFHIYMWLNNCVVHCNLHNQVHNIQCNCMCSQNTVPTRRWWWGKGWRPSKYYITSGDRHTVSQTHKYTNRHFSLYVWTFCPSSSLISYLSLSAPTTSQIALCSMVQQPLLVISCRPIAVMNLLSLNSRCCVFQKPPTTEWNLRFFLPAHPGNQQSCLHKRTLVKLSGVHCTTMYAVWHLHHDVCVYL